MGLRTVRTKPRTNGPRTVRLRWIRPFLDRRLVVRDDRHRDSSTPSNTETSWNNTCAGSDSARPSSFTCRHAPLAYEGGHFVVPEAQPVPDEDHRYRACPQVSHPPVPQSPPPQPPPQPLVPVLLLQLLSLAHPANCSPFAFGSSYRKQHFMVTSLVGGQRLVHSDQPLANPHWCAVRAVWLDQQSGGPLQRLPLLGKPAAFALPRSSDMMNAMMLNTGARGRTRQS